jgi:putative membrane protein
MKQTIIVSLFLSLLAVGCANKKDSSRLISKEEQKNLNQRPVTDAEITNAIMTANTEEMNLARLGTQKATNPQVKKFSQKMLTMHGKKIKKNHQVSNEMPEKTISALKMKFNTEEKIEELKKLKGKNFDSAFMEAQVNLHEEVLTKLDETLIPNAQDMQLKSMLEKNRSEVQNHLQEAKKISEKM